MTVRLVGEVHQRDVAEADVNFIDIGLTAWSHRAEISRIIALVRPIIDVVRLQLPELVPLVKGLIAAVWPGMARDIASNGVILIAVRVADVQRLVGVTADGVYGTATEEAVRHWQAKKGLAPDGWAGKNTVLTMGVDLLK